MFKKIRSVLLFPCILKTVYGDPVLNIHQFPKLKKLLEEKGHSLDYTCIDATDMVKSIMAAAKKEYFELQEAVRKKPGKISESDKEALQSWPLVGRNNWIKRNQDFLDKIEGDGNKNYIDSVFLSFKYLSNEEI